VPQAHLATGGGGHILKVMSEERSNGDSPNVIALPPLIYAAGFGAGWLLQWLAPIRVAWGRPGEIWGLGFAILSGLLALWARQTMARAGTNVDPRKPVTAIVTGGPFRFTRNPLYVSLALLVAGVALRFEIPWALVMLAPTLLVVRNGVILREERYLAAKFGAAYLDYQKRVRRWV
jgi:protein-S-isoprenylcysteine O-methyltransferase Ste14